MAVNLPDLLTATFEELQEGLSKQLFTSVDLVKVRLSCVPATCVKKVEGLLCPSRPTKLELQKSMIDYTLL